MNSEKNQEKEMLVKNNGKFKISKLFNKIDATLASCNYSYLLWAFFIPAFILFLIYVRMDVYPFGRSSVLVLDLNGQYVQFFAALRSAIYGESSFLYSFGRSLGGEFLGIYAYYLASPFSYIVALFPKDNLLEALFLMFVLKCGSAGLSFGVYMHNSQRCNKSVTVALSVLYALSSYFVVMHHNTMWIDALILLPLLTLGIERLVKYKKPALYVITLALTLLSNYYIGYMSCIFVALYYFYYVLSNLGTKADNPLNEKRHFIRSLLRMGLYTVLGIGIAAILLIPAYYSLTFGKTDFTNPDFSFTSKFGFIDFIAKLFPGSYDTVRPEGLPWVYSGVLSVILLPLYFLTKKISWQEKLASACFILILFASMNINTLDMIWHGFQAPNWLNYRYSFMFSFLLLILAGRALTLIREVGYEWVLGSAAVSAILVVIMQKLNLTCLRDGEDFEYFSDINGVWLSIFCLAIYGAILMLMSKHRPYSPKIDKLALVMVGVICVEVFLNGVFYTKNLNDDVVISSYDSYHDYYDKYEGALKFIEENEEDKFYRTEKTETRNVTDGFVFNTNGIASSTSTLDADVVKFIARLGIKADSHWTEYKGSNSVLDSFFGIKYLITKPEETASSLYTEVYADEFTKVYKNPYALSLAFASSPSVNDVTFELPTDLIDYEYVMNDATNNYEWVVKSEFEDTLWSPFERMNAILSAISGKEVTVYEGIEHTMEKTSTVTQESSLWNHYVFKSEIGDTSACITFNLTATRDGDIYCFFPTKYSREIKVMVNEKFLSESDGDYIYPYDNNANIAIILNLGSYKAGERVMVDVYIDAYGEFYLTEGTPYFCYINEEELASVMTDISKSNLNITEFSHDYIEGTINCDGKNNTVLFTIPYDAGWNVKVNGKKVETYETLECLMAFDLPTEAGTYSITMKYFPSCYKAGIVISIASLAAFVLILILIKKNKDKEQKEGPSSKLKNVFIPVSSDVLSEELSLMDLEKKEEEQEELLKKAAKKKKKGKK